MEIAAAAVLGIIQGLTEFLPISSSAHLILVPWILGWNPEGLIFDVSLHVGTAVAILAYFWRDWVVLGKEFLHGLLNMDPFGNHYRKLAWLLIVGTIPAMILGLLFEKTLEEKLRSPLVTVFTLALFGLILYLAERRSRQNRSIEMLDVADSVWIGFSQAAALIPGVSRSGITMTAALLRDTNRAAAARFSFMLSAPVIVGAGILQGWHFYKYVSHAGNRLDPAIMGAGVLAWPVIAVGVVSAAVTGILCIRFFLRYIQTRSFLPFVIYRFILAFIVLLFYTRQ